MIKNKKQMYIVVGVFALILMLFTTTYAFFNYTRTGTANIIRTGRINFNSEQGTAINLTNLFPIDVSEGIPNDATKVGTVTINITGDTTYGEGIEYLVSAVNVENTIGSGQSAKALPISIDVAVASNTENSPATTLGTASNNYYNDRGSTTSYYSVLASDVIENNDQLVVGYIAPGQAGVDGNIVIRAYLDASKIAISDTYPSETVRNVITTNYSSNDCETALTGVTNASTYCATAADLQDAIDNEDLTSAQITLLVNAGIVEEYTDGTTSTWVGDRIVFTTTEWNSLQTSGVSFQVKVEANEGIWVEEIRSINAMSAFPTTMSSYKSSIKEVYFSKMDLTSMQNSYDAATIKADITNNNEGRVLAWLEENSLDNTKYNLIVASDGDTYSHNSLNSFFYGMSSVTKIEFENINTSRATSMASMFKNLSNLTSVDISSFDTSNVDTMSDMFNGCSNLNSIIFGNLDTSSLTSMVRIFKDCTSLTVLDLSSFNTTHLFSSGGGNDIFSGCTSLQTVYVSDGWDLSNQPTNMPVFGNNTSLVGGNGTTWDSSNPIDKTMAIIDGTNNQDGYLTNIVDKPTS